MDNTWWWGGSSTKFLHTLQTVQQQQQCVHAGVEFYSSMNPFLEWFGIKVNFFFHFLNENNNIR